MTIPTAKDMAQKLDLFGRILLERKLITDNSLYAISSASSALKAQGETQSWDYIVSKSNKIQFVQSDQGDNGPIAPRIYTKIEVSENNDQPFIELNVALEILNDSGEPLRRWHIDCANDGQRGSQFHLQEGGHWPDRTDRENESPLKIPRWPTPPMDIILVSELIIANFYPEKWEELCENPSWIELIKSAQVFCYAFYQQKLQDSFNSSCLHKTWAGNW